MASCKKRADVSMIQISSFFSKTDIRFATVFNYIKLYLMLQHH